MRIRPIRFWFGPGHGSSAYTARRTARAVRSRHLRQADEGSPWSQGRGPESRMDLGRHRTVRTQRDSRQGGHAIFSGAARVPNSDRTIIDFGLAVVNDGTVKRDEAAVNDTCHCPGLWCDVVQTGKFPSKPDARRPSSGGESAKHQPKWTETREFPCHACPRGVKFCQYDRSVT